MSTAILDDYVAGNASRAIEAQQCLRAASCNPNLVTEAMAYGGALISTGGFPSSRHSPNRFAEPAANRSWNTWTGNSRST